MAVARDDVFRLYSTVVFSVMNGPVMVHTRAVKLFSHWTAPTPVPLPAPGAHHIKNGVKIILDSRRVLPPALDL